MKRAFLVTISQAILLSLAIMPTFVLAEDWPQFRGVNRDGKSSESGLFTSVASGAKPELLWDSTGMGSGYASVSVSGDHAYTTGNTDKGQVVVAVNNMTGKVQWTTPITNTAPKHGYDGSRCTPTIDGDRLYVVSSDGEIACLKSDSGKLVWKRDFKDWKGQMMSGWGFSESPLVDGDLVLCTPGGNDGMVVALNKMNGEEVWHTTLPNYGDENGINGKPLKDGAGYASIVVSNGGGVKQYIQLIGRGVIGIRASDGKLLWRNAKVANATANIPTVIIDGDYVFCSTAYETGSALLKLSPAGKDEVKVIEEYFLESRTMQNKHGGMVLVDGNIYCGHGNGTGLPICARLSDGKIMWGPERGSGRGEASIMYADGHLVIRFENGKVVIAKASPSEYVEVAKFDPEYQEGKSWAYPVIADGKLYLREQDHLMCYSVK